jgi:outer membrane protein assembly factor BamA
MPMYVPADDLALPMDDDSKGGELQVSITADRRNDRIEPTDGWFLAARTSYAPGGALGDHRWLALHGDARMFFPFSRSWSIGLRGSGSVVTLVGDEGLPLGPRLFGGGSYGMRGYSRDHLSPEACDAMGECDPVGGRSLVESSAELRFLPFRKQYGATLFVDAGASGATTKLDDGLSVATGLGARIRSWYVPIGVDVSYAFVRKDEVAREWDRFLVFFRIGEAF